MESSPSLHGRWPVKFAEVKRSGVTGEVTVVNAVAGKKIRVLNFFLISGSAASLEWRAGAAGATLTGIMGFAANGGISAHSINGLFEVPTKDIALVLFCSATSVVAGSVAYIEVD